MDFFTLGFILIVALKKIVHEGHGQGRMEDHDNPGENYLVADIGVPI
jgi:hypothetical protein